MTRQHTNENPSRILMSDFEGPRGSTSETARATRIMIESNVQTPEYDGIKYAALPVNAPETARRLHLPLRWVGHGFGHTTRWNRSEQAGRSETAWTAERRSRAAIVDRHSR
jgi:hypothetical protein